MRPVFADTFFFIALINERDEYHGAARAWKAGSRAPIVTTPWVLVDVLDAMASSPVRGATASFVARLLTDRATQVVDDRDLFQEGLRLFTSREDKAWSVTDCISFVVMKRRRISQALTADHHFTQAGFKALLR